MIMKEIFLAPPISNQLRLPVLKGLNAIPRITSNLNNKKTSISNMHLAAEPIKKCYQIDFAK